MGSRYCELSEYASLTGWRRKQELLSPTTALTQETPMKLRSAAALAVLAMSATLAQAQNSNQGVSKTEITLGSIQDLSGPIAGFGKQVRLGMMLRVDERE